MKYAVFAVALFMALSAALSHARSQAMEASPAPVLFGEHLRLKEKADRLESELRQLQKDALTQSLGLDAYRD